MRGDLSTVVLLTADTFRFDVFNEKGDELCPFLKQQARNGVSFTSAFSTGPGTSSAFPGIMASAYPLDYGYRGLNKEHESVAEYLSESGLRTIGVTASSHASSLFNYDRGFDVFYENPSYRRNAQNRTSLSASEKLKTRLFDIAGNIPVVKQTGSKILEIYRELSSSDGGKCPYERAETITDTAMELLSYEFREYPNSERFVWVHYMEPHAPYYPPDDVVEMFDTDGATKKLANRAYETWNKNRPKMWESKDNSDILTEKEREALKLLYEIQIRYLDREIQRLVEFVKESVGRKEVALFFTSDHGEEFFEHGDFGHRAKVYDELIHVPFFASGASPKSREVNRVVSHTDIAPTITDMLDIPANPDWRGKSLIPVIEGNDDVWDGHDYIFSELCHSGGYGGDVDTDTAIIAVVTDEWKYILNNQKGTEEVYRCDQLEIPTNNRIDDTSTDAELREIARKRLSNVAPREPHRREMSDELREQLHELGYIEE